jgi:hypothetical protein
MGRRAATQSGAPGAARNGEAEQEEQEIEEVEDLLEFYLPLNRTRLRQNACSRVRDLEESIGSRLSAAL